MKRELRAKRQQLFELAEALGYCLEKTSYFKQEFATSIARRLINRRGNFIYQATDFSIPGFSCHAAVSMFASALLMQPLADLVEEQQTVTWRATTSAQVRLMLGTLLTDLKGPTAGVSRGLRTASESCIRVIATLIPPLEVSWVRVASGLHRLYVSMIYVLSDDAGEMHFPKDANRRELGVSSAQEASYRVMVLQDAVQLQEMACPLSPGWLRQMGKEEEAQMMEARLHALTVMQVPDVPVSRRVRKPALAKFDIEMIVKEERRSKARWFLVRWEGYHPSWEAWRINGHRGEPVETWEPLATVQGTQALESWQMECT